MKNNKSFLKKTKFAWVLFFVVMLIINILKVIPFFKPLSSGMGDYGAFFLAGKIILSGNWENFYNLDFQGSLSPMMLDNGAFLPFYHLPYEAILFAPLATLPYMLSYLLWNFINLILLFFCITLIYQLVLSSINLKNELTIFSIPVLFITALAFTPVFSSFINGQDSFLLLILLLFSLKFSYTNSQFKSGFILGLAIFKPHLTIPIAIGMGIRSGKNYIFGFILSASICVAVSIYIVGFNNLDSFLIMLDTVNSDPQKYGVDSATIPNIRGFLERHSAISNKGKIQHLSILVWISGVLIISAINIFISRKCILHSLFLDSLTIIITVLCSIHIHYHDFILLLYPLFMPIPLLEFTILNKLTILQICKFIGPTLIILSPFPFNLHGQIPNAEILNVLIILLCIFYFNLLRLKLAPQFFVTKIKSENIPYYSE